MSLSFMYNSVIAACAVLPYVDTEMPIGSVAALVLRKRVKGDESPRPGRACLCLSARRDIRPPTPPRAAVLESRPDLRDAVLESPEATPRNRERAEEPPSRSPPDLRTLAQQASSLGFIRVAEAQYLNSLSPAEFLNLSSPLTQEQRLALIQYREELGPLDYETFLPLDEKIQKRTASGAELCRILKDHDTAEGACGVCLEGMTPDEKPCVRLPCSHP